MTPSPETPSEPSRKKIDDSWKDAVAKEKTSQEKAPAASEEKLQETHFSLFLSSLGFQTMIALGELPDPVTAQKKPPHLEQAKYLIDTIDMLVQKTQGNLTNEESAMAQNLLYQLRVLYLQKNQASQKEGPVEP